MVCLGLDTTGEWCSAALVNSSSILARERKKINRGHAEILGPMVQGLLTRAQIKPENIAKIAVCTGPGSFTGLRVGLAFAKGFALPHKTEIVGLSALEVWARGVDPEACRSVFTVADVRRDQLFWQIFNDGKPAGAPALTDIKSAVFAAKRTTFSVGNGAALVGGLRQDTYVCPARLAWLGLEASSLNRPATPLYHRPPDAKLSGGKTL